MKARVKTLGNYQDRAEADDCFWLLQKIRAVTMELDQKKHGNMSLLDARCELLNCRQGHNQTVSKFKETLKGWADAIRLHGGTVAERVGCSVNIRDAAGNERTAMQREELRRKRLLLYSLCGGARTQANVGPILWTCQTSLSRECSSTQRTWHPPKVCLSCTNPPSTTHSMTKRQQPPRVAGTATRAASSEASALTFTQQGPTHAERVAASVAGTDGVIHPVITCRSGCQGKCPGATTTGTTLMQHSLMLAQSNRSSSDPSGILLDSQSTISVFKNPAMLTNIRRSKHTLRALTNGAHQDSNMFGDFPNLGKGFSTTASQSQT